MRKDFCIIKNGFINLDELVYETIFIIVFWDYDSESEESSKGEVVRVPKIASPRVRPSSCNFHEVPSLIRTKSTSEVAEAVLLSMLFKSRSRDLSYRFCDPSMRESGDAR